MVTWLKKCKIDTVAMESTGIYWIPVYNILEKAGFKVCLVNAYHVKNVPGRKSDVLDCQWLQQLHTYGLLRSSAIPSKKIRKLRDLDRHRDSLTQYRSAHIQHMQKALHLMNLQLDNVISDITGKTGLKIIRSIISGQRDPKQLANYRDPNCKKSPLEIEWSLEGTYDHEYIFQLKQALELYEFYTQKIEECDQKMEQQYEQLNKGVSLDTKPLPPSRKKNTHSKNKPEYDLRSHLYHLCGVDLTQIDGLNTSTVQTILMETGVDMSKWRTDKHFTSWLGTSPCNDISGGKVLRSRTKKNKNRATIALHKAAQSLHHSNSYLGAFYRRMKARLGPAKANTAAANKIAKLIFYMLTNQVEYQDLGADYYITKNKQRAIKNLEKQAKKLGLMVIPAPDKQ